MGIMLSEVVRNPLDDIFINKDVLMEHQRRCIEYMLQKGNPCIGAMFMDTGTGKTCTTIGLMTILYNAGLIDTAVIIAPKGVHLQWAKDEIPKWLSRLSPCFIPYVVNTPESKSWDSMGTGLTIYCINYDKFSIGQGDKLISAVKGKRVMVVCDEATRIKNPGSKRTQAILNVFCDVQKKGRVTVSKTPWTLFRYILTGTPVTGAIKDLWSMFEFLLPNYTGYDFYAFQSRYTYMTTIQAGPRTVRTQLTKAQWEQIRKSHSINTLPFSVSLDTYLEVKKQEEWKGPCRRIEECMDKIRDDAFSITINDCVDLKEKVYIRRSPTLTSEQAKAYKSMVKDLLVFDSETMTIAQVQTALHASMKLQQLTSGFMIGEEFAPGEQEVEQRVIRFKDNPKLNALISDIDALPEEEQGIIICTYTEEVKMLLEHEMFDSAVVHTGTVKRGSLEDFTSGGSRFLIANLQAIATGFNLQNAHYMFFFSNSYSFENRYQVEARIYRQGQKQKCVYYDYIIENTMDTALLEALKNKKDLLNVVMESTFSDVIGGTYGI